MGNKTSKRKISNKTQEAFLDINSQLIAAGVLEKSDYPGFDDETGILPADEDDGSDEDIEVELVDEEPLFLRGQTKYSVSHSPVKIVKVARRVI